MYKSRVYLPIFKCILLVLAAAYVSACYSSLNENKSDIEEYQTDIERANQSINKKDYEKAKEYVLSAIKVAERIRWNQGIINAKFKLGVLYMGDKNCIESEKTFKQIIEICNKGLCEAKDLGDVYDKLFLLYLNCDNDLSKVSTLIETVITSKDILSPDKDIHDRLKGYAEDLDFFGFKNEAKTLRERSETIL